MKNLNKYMAIIAGAMLARPAVFAQNADSSSSSSSSKRSSSSQASGQQGSVRLTQFIGANVKSSDGQRLGDINDLVVQNGQIQFAVLGVGGVLGIGEKWTPVPWQALNYTGEKEFAMSIDKDKLKQAPTLQHHEWSQLSTPEFTSRVYSFYGVKAPEAVGGTGSQFGTEHYKSKSKSSSGSSSQSSDQLEKSKSQSPKEQN